MSDETTTAPPAASYGMFEHWCEHPGCKAWGGFGYDIGKGETKRFCQEHRGQEYPQPRGGTAF